MLRCTHSAKDKCIWIVFHKSFPYSKEIIQIPFALYLWMLFKHQHLLIHLLMLFKHGGMFSYIYSLTIFDFLQWPVTRSWLSLARRRMVCGSEGLGFAHWGAPASHCCISFPRAVPPAALPFCSPAQGQCGGYGYPCRFHSEAPKAWISLFKERSDWWACLNDTFSLTIVN